MELFFNDMVEEIALEVYFELHRAVKLGYFEYCYPEENAVDSEPSNVDTLKSILILSIYVLKDYLQLRPCGLHRHPHFTVHINRLYCSTCFTMKHYVCEFLPHFCSAFESHVIVQDKSLDIFGNSAQDIKKFVECPCPKCSRLLGTSKFAPHLEKCLGMGRISSRIANKKSSPIIDSDDEDDENEGEEWIFPVPEKKINNKSKPKKDTKQLLERPSSNSPKLLVKGSRSSERSISPAVSETSNTRPIGVVYTVEYFKSLSNDQKRSALQEMCGVISERTKRLCTRSVNCPQHTEEQKRRLRMTIMDSSNDTESPHPSKKLKLENSASHSRSHDESESTGLSVESGDKQRSRSPHHSGQSALSAAAATGKTKKSSSKKSKSHHDLSSSSSTSKKSKLKNKQANKQPVAVKTYTDMPIF